MEGHLMHIETLTIYSINHDLAMNFNDLIFENNTVSEGLQK